MALGRNVHKIQFKEAQIHWDKFFSSERYRTNLEARILAGEAQSLEIHLFNLTYGKPKETIDLQHAGDGTFILHIGGAKVNEQALEDGEVKKALPEGPVILEMKL